MKRIIAALILTLGLTLALTPLMSVAPPASSAVEWTGQGIRYDRLTHTFAGDEVGQATLYYRYQTGGFTSDGLLRIRIKPDFMVVSYNMPGTTMSCNSTFRKYDGMGFNMYAWQPYDGKAFNPPRIDVGCDTSTTNSDVQEYEPANTPWLYWGNVAGGGDSQIPHWKVTFTLRYNGFPDASATESRKFSPNDGT